MFNKVILVGNLTRNVELRYLPSGQAVAKCGIATNRRYKDAAGQPKEETMFIDFTLWGRNAEVANQYLQKGSRVLIEGRLVLEQWTDQTGQRRSRHSVSVESLKMLDRKGEGPVADGGYATDGGYADPAPQGGYGAPAQTSRPQGYESHQAPQPSGQEPPSTPEKIPEIDVDNDDIPF